MASLHKARKFAKRLGPVGYWLYLRSQFGTAPFAAKIPDSNLRCWLRPGSSDLKTFRAIFGEREYSFREYARPEVIVDAGANIGLASLYFASLFPDARILALEPEPSNFELLRRNCASHPNITPLRRALWSRSGALNIANPGGEKWCIRMEEAEDGAGEIPAIDVPDLMKEFGLDHIDILKVDIEGGEAELFAGYPTWIEKVRVLVIELHDRFRVGCSAAFYPAMARHDFEEFRSGENVIMVNRADAPEASRANDRGG
jgi:FkbM family methyltransferase